MLDLLQVHCPELKISNESYDWQLVPRDFVVMARRGATKRYLVVLFSACLSECFS